MLALPHTNSWGFVYTTLAGWSGTPGVSVTPGASDAEGTVWGEIGPDASITTDIHYVHLVVNGGGTSGQAKNHLLDFGWDAAGGTSYVPWFENLACGGSGNLVASSGHRHFHFPCRIPAGSAIAVRIQGSNGTAGSVRVFGRFYGKPSRPELWRNAAYAETLGYTSGTRGTSFSPGNTSFGSWADLGAATKKHHWVLLGTQIDSGTLVGQSCRVQVAVGDGSNKHVIGEHVMASTNTELIGNDMQAACQWEVPAGANIYVRGAASGAADTGYNATAVLFGG